MNKVAKQRITENRALALVELINHKFGGNSSKFAKEVGISRSLVHGWTSCEKTFGDKAAEKIELRLQIPGNALQRGLLGFFEQWVEAGEPDVINQSTQSFSHPLVDVLDGLMIIRDTRIRKHSDDMDRLRREIESLFARTIANLS